MKIRYTSRRLKFNFGYGIMMIGAGLYAVFVDHTSFFSYVWLVLGLIQTGISIFEKTFQYLSIENNILTKHSLFPKSVALSEIKGVRKYIDNYRIEAENTSISIDKGIIEEDCLHELDRLLSSLELNSA